jgi:folate-binding protein YgfZ
MPSPQLLAHRSIVSVTGAEADTFLNGILTVSTIGIATGEIRYGGLLTPQGKVIADMLLAREDEAILLDCAAPIAASLLKRLQLFKLRAVVKIEERFDLGAIAFDGEPDPRDASAPRRRIGPRADPSPGDPARYHAARIAAGLPEQAFDFASEEVFPADINMDLLSGIDFKKGCFVGQEVVSRMKRRGTARRRTLKAAVPANTSAPSPVLTNGFEIGMLTSISGDTGLARVRIDRMAEAIAKNEAFTASGRPIRFDTPAWLAEELAALAQAKRPSHDAD